MVLNGHEKSMKQPTVGRTHQGWRKHFQESKYGQGTSSPDGVDNNEQILWWHKDDNVDNGYRSVEEEDGNWIVE